MKRKIVVNFSDERSRWALTPAALAQLQAALPPDWELLHVTAPVSSRGDGSGTSQAALAAVRGAEIYTGFGFARDLFEAATSGPDARLRWVHSGAAGVGALLYPEMLASDVVVTNSAGIHADPMAETIMAAALHFARGFDFAVRSQARAVWDQSAFETVDSPIVELAGQTLGLLGFGGIGRAVAVRAQALGMRVLATRRSGSGVVAGVATFSGDAGLEHVLRESDVLVIALPSTPRTRGLLNRARLQLLKPGAVLINVARGNITVESDLLEALSANRLRGAALDVFETEPLPSDSPLWRLPNVLVLPHVSATTPRFWEREVELILDNFARYLQGKPLRNVVDKNEGY